MNLIIKPLTPSLVTDFFSFFDTTAFADNPAWSVCYCHFFYIPDNETWMKRTGDQNRLDTEVRIRENKMHGFLAYSGEKPIGFCNADYKTNYPRLVAQKELWEDDKKITASMVCFIIAHDYRRKGIATRLLKAVYEYYVSQKCEFLEAYPRKNVSTDADHYYGPLSMYEKQGFKTVKEFDEFYVVRRVVK